MSCTQAIEEALMNLPKEFECEKLDEKTWLVTTPFEYPDGDLIQLYIIKMDNLFEVTDLAETLRFFETLDFDLLSSKRRRKLFEDILRSYKIEFFKGELKVKVKTEELLKAILDLSQAIFRVSDLYFLQRIGVTTTFKEEVEEVLKEANLNYEIDYSIFGKSGKEYKVDFYIDVEKPNLLEAISTYSKMYAERLIDRVVRMWYDIKRLDGRFEYVTIVDDRSDVWKKEHFDLLEDLSKVYVWSEVEDYIVEIS
jgi:hypothetical protein